jgi:tetrapyrrole methylase family protein / MazG family protein
MIIIAGLGPGGADQLTQAVLDEIKRADSIYLRTQIHPTVKELESMGLRFLSFDHLYETAESFDQVYQQIAEQITTVAENSDVLYAVPGHPLVGEKSVEILLGLASDKAIPVRILPGVSFVEAVLEAVRANISRGLIVFDALSIDELHPDPSLPLIIYQVHDRFVASQVKLMLLEHYDPEIKIAVIRAAGVPKDQCVDWVILHELDHTDIFDHLTTLWIPAVV